MSLNLGVTPPTEFRLTLTNRDDPLSGAAFAQSGRSAAAAFSQAIPSVSGTRATVRVSPLPVSMMTELAPMEIEARLGSLIRRCLSQRSVAMAFEVVQHIEALCAHPDYHSSWEERCAYRRLAQHWRGLAWTAIDRTESAKGPSLDGLEKRPRTVACPSFPPGERSD